MFLTLFLVVCLSFGINGVPIRLDEPVVFHEKSVKVDNNVITPPVLPVIEHLENDPTTLTKEDVEKRARRIENGHHLDQSMNFNYSPDQDGGVFVTYSRGFSGNVGDSRNRAGSQSLRMHGSPDKGFKIEHSRSGSHSTNGNHHYFGGSGHSESISTNHASGFSTKFNDASSSSSLGFPPGVAEKLFDQLLKGEPQGREIPPIIYKNIQESPRTISHHIRTIPEHIITIPEHPRTIPEYPNTENGQVNVVPSHEVYYYNLGAKNPENTFKFPGESTNRHSKVQYQTVPVYENQNKKKPSLYDIIKIEV